MDPLLEGTVARSGGDALRTFRDAFVTELGLELQEGRLVSLRELLDVVICAGKDATIQDMRRLRPFASDKEQLFSFEECFQIYQSVPPTGLEELYDLFGAFAAADGEEVEQMGLGLAQQHAIPLDYGPLVGHFEKEGADEQLLAWLREHAEQGTDLESVSQTGLCRTFSRFQLIYEIVDCKKRLRTLNAQIVEEKGLDRRMLLLLSQGGHDDRWAPAATVAGTSAAAADKKVSNASFFMLPRSESAESLSSLFSNRNAQSKMASGGEEASTVGPSQQPPQQQPKQSTSVAFRALPEQTAGEERIQLKSLVIQREASETSCIAYAFALERPRKLRLSLCVNEGIDSSLSRFHNSVFGLLMSSEMEPQTRIYAVTRRKENGMSVTDWVHVPAGNHLIRVKFCRSLKIVEPEKSDHIVDDKVRLTKSFKVMLMNLFDGFDLDEDGMLSRREFEAYSILSGSGPVSEQVVKAKHQQSRPFQEWTKICENFELRQQNITMKTFIQMHQKEAESYGPKGNMEEMWKAVRALGHNRRFFMSTTCPLRLELHCSEGPILIEPFRVDRFHSDELDPLLAEHFWEMGKPLPYLRDLHSLRQYKADYFVVLVAGRAESQMHYLLDLSSSNNVNIEGSELRVNQIMPPNTIRILTVAISQAESWFLSVKLVGKQENKPKEKAMVVAAEKTSKK